MTDESPYTVSDQSPSSSTTYDTANRSMQNISQTRPLSISPISQYNSNYIATTQPQLLLLLTNDLQQKRHSNKIIVERLINDQKEFEGIEKILNSKIRRYQQNIQQKLQDSNFDHMDDLLNEIIELDEKSSKIKKEIRKKKWYQDKNEIYRTITSNNELLNNIDDMTQKIDYWQQMLLVTAQGYHSPHNNNKKNKNKNSNNGDITPFVIKEVLRIKSENQKILNDLRSKLDEIRSKKV